MHTNEPIEKLLTRKERERLLRRSEILAAAREVFALKGFAEATLDEIAEKAEFGKGTLYNYFASKEELFAAVITEGYNHVVEVLETISKEESDNFVETYLEISRILLTHLMKDVGLFILLLRDSQPVAHSKLMEYFPLLVDLTERPLKRAIANGTAKPCPTSEVASIFISTIFSMFKHHYFMETASCHEMRFDSIPTYSQEEIEKQIVKTEEILMMTFFEGILSKRDE